MRCSVCSTVNSVRKVPPGWKDKKGEELLKKEMKENDPLDRNLGSDEATTIKPESEDLCDF